MRDRLDRDRSAHRRRASTTAGGSPRQGHALSKARKRLDADEAARELQQITSALRDRRPRGTALAETVEALQAQLSSAQRMDNDHQRRAGAAPPDRRSARRSGGSGHRAVGGRRRRVGARRADHVVGRRRRSRRRSRSPAPGHGGDGSARHGISVSDTRPVSEIEQATDAQIVRSSAVVGVGTALSRITGLLRTVVLAYVARPLRARRCIQPRQHHAEHRLRPDPRRGPVRDARTGLRRPVPARRRRRRERGRHGRDERADRPHGRPRCSPRPGSSARTRGQRGRNAAELERAGVPLLRLFAAADPVLRAHGARHGASSTPGAASPRPPSRRSSTTSSCAGCCCCSPHIAGRDARVPPTSSTTRAGCGCSARERPPGSS